MTGTSPVDGRLAEIVAERLAEVRRRIVSAGGDLDAVRVVAVTKGFDVTAVEAALAAGVYDIGENYADELLRKAGRVGASRPGGTAASRPSATHAPRERWHYLGAVQRRKVRDLAPVVDYWQAVWRVEEGETIAKHRPGAAVFVEVDVAGLQGRPGVAWADAPALVTDLRGLGLDVRGLMAVGPPGPPEQARPAFRRLAALGRQLGLAELSMGMTDDLEVAVSEGATIVRVGRALFGPRPSPAR